MNTTPNSTQAAKLLRAGWRHLCGDYWLAPVTPSQEAEQRRRYQAEQLCRRMTVTPEFLTAAARLNIAWNSDLNTK